MTFRRAVAFCLATLVVGCNCGPVGGSIRNGADGGARGGAGAGSSGAGGNGTGGNGSGAGGIIEPGSGGSGAGGGPGVGLDPDGGVCGRQLSPVGFAPKTPNVIIAFDRSGSMHQPFGNGTRYTVERDILKQLVTDFQSKIRFGFEAFPIDTNSSPCSMVGNCCASPVLVPPALNNAPAIHMALEAAGFGSASQTPTALALRACNDFYKTFNDGIKERYVLLSTDGQPNASLTSCSADSRTAENEAVSEVASLLSAGIKTFVLGVSDQSFGQALESMARAGGAPRDGGPPSYYPAATPDQLKTQLGSIIGGVAMPSCTIDLTSMPADPKLVAVYFDGVQIPNSPSRTEGWEYQNNNTQIVIYGSYCQRVLNRQVMNLEILFGCAPVIN